MRTILSLALALVMGTGIVTLSGCEKKASMSKETKEKVSTPTGGTTTTEKTEKTETTPPTK
jgi:hypothetical protein